ncbi:MAG: hypothetical protein NUW37_15675 [Planctomycetes bacterium]|nr:hypothetical protein [Planctomycetota bacterium]
METGGDRFLRFSILAGLFLMFSFAGDAKERYSARQTESKRGSPSKEGIIDVGGIWVVDNDTTSFSCALDSSHSSLLHPIGLTPSFLISQTGNIIEGAPFDPDAISTTGSGEVTGNTLVYNLSVVSPSSEAQTEYELTFSYQGEVCFDEGGNICFIEGTFQGSGSGEFPDFSGDEPTTVSDSCSWEGTFTAWIFPLPLLGSSLTLTSHDRVAHSEETLTVCPGSEISLTQRIESGGTAPSHIAETVAQGMEFVWTDSANPDGLSLDDEVVFDDDNLGLMIQGDFTVEGPDTGMLTVIPVNDGEAFALSISVIIVTPNALRIVRAPIRAPDLEEFGIVEVRQSLEIPRDEPIDITAVPTWTGPNGILDDLGAGDDVDCFHLAGYIEDFDVEIEDFRPRGDHVTISSGVIAVPEVGVATVARIVASRTGHGTIAFFSHPNIPGVPGLTLRIPIRVLTPLVPLRCDDVTSTSSLSGPTAVCESVIEWVYNVSFVHSQGQPITISSFEYDVVIAFSLKRISAVIDSANVGDEFVPALEGERVNYTYTRTNLVGNSLEIKVRLELRNEPADDIFDSVWFYINPGNAELIVGGTLCNVSKPPAKSWRTYLRSVCTINLCFVLLYTDHTVPNVELGAVDTNSPLFQNLTTANPDGTFRQDRDAIIALQDAMNEILEDALCMNVRISVILRDFDKFFSQWNETYPNLPEPEIFDLPDRRRVVEISDSQAGANEFTIEMDKGTKWFLTPSAYDPPHRSAIDRPTDPLPDFTLEPISIPKYDVGCIPFFFFNDIDAKISFGNATHTEGSAIGITNWDVDARPNFTPPDDIARLTPSANPDTEPAGTNEIHGPSAPRTAVFADESAGLVGGAIDTGKLARDFSRALAQIFIGPHPAPGTLLDPASTNNDVPPELFDTSKDMRDNDGDFIEFLKKLGCED